MTHTIDMKSKRHPSAMLVAGLAITAGLALGPFVGSAKADGPYDHRDWSERGDQQHWDHRGDHRDWDHRDREGYYRTPPIVYGSPYYEPPPVVYGPGFGLSVPGLNIQVR